jgi:hypothetical protein
MKTESETVEIPEKLIKASVQNIKWFIADDGTRFLQEKECVAYETSLLKKRVHNSFKTIGIDLSDSFLINDTLCIWKKIETPDQLRYAQLETGVGLTEKERNRDYVLLNDSNIDINLKIGDWYSFFYEYGGDDSDTRLVYTLEYFKNYLEKILKAIDIKTS